MPSVRCPVCRAKYEVADELMGRQLKCRCNYKFIANVDAEEPLANDAAPHDVALKGPPPIHQLKFESPPKYNSLLWISYLSEGAGSLMLCANLLVLLWIAFSGTWLVLLVIGPFMVTVLFYGLFLVGVSELIRLLIRMQHDSLRTREYMHYVTWSLLTERPPQQ